MYNVSFTFYRRHFCYCPSPFPNNNRNLTNVTIKPSRRTERNAKLVSIMFRNCLHSIRQKEVTSLNQAENRGYSSLTELKSFFSELRFVLVVTVVVEVVANMFVCQRTPSINDVSRLRNRVLIKVISLRVFSKISLGSSEGQRRQLGAHTIDKLFTSIFVTAHMSGRENICKQQKR